MGNKPKVYTSWSIPFVFANGVHDRKDYDEIHVTFSKSCDTCNIVVYGVVVHRKDTDEYICGNPRNAKTVLTAGKAPRRYENTDSAVLGMSRSIPKHLAHSQFEVLYIVQQSRPAPKLPS